MNFLLSLINLGRPPNHSNQDTILNEKTIYLTKASPNYEIFIMMSDFNNKLSAASAEANKFEDFFCLFDLINLIKQGTCFTKNRKSIIDLIQTNRHSSFRHVKASETG